MTKLNKLKSGLVGLILLGTSSIANADTIKIGNDKITYHDFGCVEKIVDKFDNASTFRFNYTGNCKNLKVNSIYKNGKLLEKNSTKIYKELEKYVLQKGLLSQMDIQNKITFKDSNKIYKTDKKSWKIINEPLF